MVGWLTEWWATDGWEDCGGLRLGVQYKNRTKCDCDKVKCGRGDIEEREWSSLSPSHSLTHSLTQSQEATTCIDRRSSVGRRSSIARPAVGRRIVDFSVVRSFVVGVLAVLAVLAVLVVMCLLVGRLRVVDIIVESSSQDGWCCCWCVVKLSKQCIPGR